MEEQETIHYSQLAPMEPGSMIAQEWDTYRREVGRLLAEGHEGRWALIKGDRVVCLFDTEEEVRAEVARRFLLQPYLMHQVRCREPIRYWVHYRLYCYDQETIHYSQLSPADPGSPLAREWETYRREVARLLAEGHEGRWALIKGDQVVCLFDTEEEAYAQGLRRFLLDPPYFIQQVRSREPLYRYLPAYHRCHT